MGGAVAVGDFDRDGDQDVFILGGGQRTDKLLYNDGTGKFVRVKNSGLEARHQGTGIAVGDFDSDGWLDLFVQSHGPASNPTLPGQHKLYRNNGDGTFSDVAGQAGVATTSPIMADGFGAAFGDYDLDGDLDLFAGSWRVRPVASLGNRLFRNNGDGTFTDVTAVAGVGDPLMRSFSPCFADMDGDLWPELLVAADSKTSHYFVNDRDGTFTDLTKASGTGKDTAGMGAAVGDVNNDGLLDWYVTAIWEPLQPQLWWRGNKLYLNQGAHTYREVSRAANVHDGEWGWGTVLVDFDHDGRLDIAETNGWRADPQWEGTPARLWINQGNDPGGVPSFVDVASAVGFHQTTQGRSLVNFDADGDGGPGRADRRQQRAGRVPAERPRRDADALAARPSRHERQPAPGSPTAWGRA